MSPERNIEPPEGHIAQKAIQEPSNHRDETMKIHRREELPTNSWIALHDAMCAN